MSTLAPSFRPLRLGAALAAAGLILAGCATAPGPDAAVDPAAAFARAVTERQAQPAASLGRSGPEALSGIWPTVDRGREAHATLEALVDEAGRVIAVRVVTTDDAAWAEACSAALRQWVFRPGERDGRPVAAVVTQRFKRPAS